MFKKAFVALLLLVCSSACLHASDYYATQGGGAAGVCTSNVHDQNWVQDSANWGIGAGKINPGDTLHLCGAWTWSAGSDGIRPRVDDQAGTASSPITIDATGATFHAPYFNTYAINISTSAYIILNGGTYGNTNNGSASGGYTYQHNDGRAIWAEHCDNCEIRNTTVANTYVHTAVADHCCVLIGVTYSGVNFKIHDNTFHDNGVDLNLVDSSYGGGSTPGGYQIYNNTFYNYNWGMDCGSNSGAISSISVHDNHFGSTANWDTDNDSFHKNAAHCFSTPPKKIQTMYIYNNLVDGDWGSCCVTSIGFFLESSDTPWTDGTGTAYIFNNVIAPSHYGNGGVGNGLINVGSGTGNLIANNTIIGPTGTDGACIISNTILGAAPGVHMTIENNVIEGCSGLINAVTSGQSYDLIDYNVYGNSSGTAWHWQWIGTMTDSFSAWQSACGCDSHSISNIGNSLTSMSAVGAPSAGFAGVGMGANLTKMAAGPLASLAYDTSAGNTRQMSQRPTTSSWDSGAYLLHGTATLTQGPTPPFGLTAVVR